MALGVRHEGDEGIPRQKLADEAVGYVSSLKRYPCTRSIKQRADTSNFRCPHKICLQ